MPPTTVDYTPTAQEIKDQGDQGIIDYVTDGNTATIMQAEKSLGMNVPILATSGALGNLTVQAFKSTGVPVYVTSAFDLNSKASAMRAAMLKSMKKYAPSEPDIYSDGSVTSWLGPT